MKARVSVGEAVAALKRVMMLVESGSLVRDISKDGERDWMIKQFALVSILKTASDLIAKAEGR